MFMLELLRHFFLSNQVKCQSKGIAGSLHLQRSESLA